MKAVLLVGGLGTRLRALVPNRPKPLARIGDTSFLALLLEQLRRENVRDVVLCTGYMAEQVEAEFGDGTRVGMNIVYSRETEPLGTAGALRLAQSHVAAETFIVMNGDSFVEVDFTRLRTFHQNKGGIATMVLSRVDNASRYGTVEIDDLHHVRNFAEKTGRDGPGLINAGVYICEPTLFQYLPEYSGSLERDVFPRLIGRGLFGLEQSGLFIDIGTPDDYLAAQHIRDRLRQTVNRRADTTSLDLDAEKRQ
jgi:D-glycero-alpha-D-manno-heptose 1-phosphate guanylyltransferase